MALQSVMYWLPIVAIVLAVLALVPYGLECFLYVRRRPRYNVEVASVRRWPSNGDKMILGFELRLSLRESSKPAVLTRVSIGFPWHIAQPIAHPQYEEAPEWIRRSQQAMLTPRMGTTPVESGLRLILYEGEMLLTPPKPAALAVWPLAFRVEAGINMLTLDAVMRSEADRVALGFWSIFYHASEYVAHQSICVAVPTETTK
ncbi:hypothetical protein ES703_13968 [subsurface metagenome]